jgi:hypothetical protein
MALPNVFTKEVSEEIVNRINKLTPETKGLWGKMSVSQMLAHCAVTYEYEYEPTKYKAPGGFMKFILKLVLKPIVVNEKPYKKNSGTGSDFLVKDDKNFAAEKERLIGFVRKTQELGAKHFDGKTSHSFGPLTSTEYNNMFYKHLNHHLSQFGV